MRPKSNGTQHPPHRGPEDPMVRPRPPVGDMGIFSFSLLPHPPQYHRPLPATLRNTPWRFPAHPARHKSDFACRAPLFRTMPISVEFAHLRCLPPQSDGPVADLDAEPPSSFKPVSSSRHFARHSFVWAVQRHQHVDYGSCPGPGARNRNPRRPNRCSIPVRGRQDTPHPPAASGLPSISEVRATRSGTRHTCPPPQEPARLTHAAFALPQSQLSMAVLELLLSPLDAGAAAGWRRIFPPLLSQILVDPSARNPPEILVVRRASKARQKTQPQIP